MASSSHDVTSQAQRSGPSLPPGPDLDILIVGKTGHGKSATANSILEEECFSSDGDTSSVTTLVGVFQKEMEGRKLMVIDTPGISDTEIEDAEASHKKAKEDFCLAISLSPEGFHSIILVFRYGQRMTKEEVDAIKILKALLGENFISDHGVILITYGDDFKKKMKGKKSFKTWCEEQKGYMHDVLQQCQNRCVLFDNEGDDNVLKQQRFDLVQMIDRMKSGNRYNDGIFKILKDARFNDLKLDAQKGFLDSSRIYFDMARLVKEAQVCDQRFVDEMRRKIDELKIAVKELRVFETKIDENIKRAEDNINQLEKKIQSRTDEYLKSDSDSIVILGNIYAVLDIILGNYLKAAIMFSEFVRKVMPQIERAKCVIL